MIPLALQTKVSQKIVMTSLKRVNL